jgi:hypothetical protein
MLADDGVLVYDADVEWTGNIISNIYVNLETEGFLLYRAGDCDCEGGRGVSVDKKWLPQERRDCAAGSNREHLVCRYQCSREPNHPSDSTEVPIAGPGLLLGDHEPSLEGFIEGCGVFSPPVYS